MTAFFIIFISSGMWQYNNIGTEGSTAGPSTSGGHHSTSAPHHPSVAGTAAAASGSQPELTDMLHMLDQSGSTNFDDLNMFNANFE